MCGYAKINQLCFVGFNVCEIIKVIQQRCTFDSNNWIIYKSC